MRPWLELARVSNLPTVWTNVTAGWLLAGGGLGWSDPRLLWLLLAGSLMYTGGMILNDAADVGYDRAHRAERPIPSGRVSAGMAWAVGLLMLLGGALLAWLGADACGWLTLGLVAAILFYDLYHKPWSGAVWVMGACRVLLVWVAGTAGMPDSGCPVCWGLPRAVIAPGLALGAYIVGLTMVARMEGRGTPPAPLASFFARALLYLPGVVAAAQVFSSERVVSGTLLKNLSQLLPLLFVMVLAVGILDAVQGIKRGGSVVGWTLALLILGITLLDTLAIFEVHLPAGLFLVSIIEDFRPLAPLAFVLLFAVVTTHAMRVMKQGGPAIGRAVGLLLAGIPLVDALAIAPQALWLAGGFAVLPPILRLWQRWVAAT